MESSSAISESPPPSISTYSSAFLKRASGRHEKDAPPHPPPPSWPHVRMAKLQHSRFGPIAFPPPRSRNKTAMPAGFRGHDLDLRIPRQFENLKGLPGHDRIVLGSKDQRRHGNPLRHAQRARLFVIIGGIAIAAERSRDGLVELAHGPHAAQAIQFELPGEEFRLAP